MLSGVTCVYKSVALHMFYGFQSNPMANPPNPFKTAKYLGKSYKCHPSRRCTWWFLGSQLFTKASNLICFIDFQSKSNGKPCQPLTNCEIPRKNHVNVIHLGGAHGGFCDCIRLQKASNLICFMDFQSKSNGKPSKSLPNCEIPLKNHVNVVHLGDAHGGFSVTVVHESVKLYTFL